MAKIKTVDYSTLTKQSVGRPKTQEDKGDHVFNVILKTSFSDGFNKVKFKIRNNIPSLYFTNRETNVINDNEYLNDIVNDIFSLEYSKLEEGIYNIVPVGYHWFNMEKTQSMTENCCIVKKI